MTLPTVSAPGFEEQRPIPLTEEVQAFLSQASTSWDPRLAATLGSRYRFVSVLGEGGMSVVYLAHDLRLDRPVAIKVLHRHLARDPEARVRFSREAKAVAKLAHPNIPEVYDFSQENEGLAYLVSEYIDGPSLAGLLQSTTLSPEHGVLIALGILRALSHAHASGIVHRDVKPENILLGRDGLVRLTDFGIAQVAGLESMTQTGTLIGSPAHMSPEQIDGTRTLTPQVDLWAFGTVLYMLVTGGVLPFRGDNTHQLLKRITDGTFEDPRRVSPHVDSTLACVIRHCLSLSPQARPEQASTLLEQLENWLEARSLREDESAELKRLLADPQGHTVLFQHTLPERLLKTAAQLETRSPHEALDLYGRILTLNPDCVPASQRLRKLERRLRARQGLVWMLGLGLVVALGALATYFWPESTPSVVVSAPQAQTLQKLTQHTPPQVFQKPPSQPAPTTPPTVAKPSLEALGTVHGQALSAAVSRPLSTRDPVSSQRQRLGRPTTPTETVDVRFTAYPPALRITVANRTITAGSNLSLAPGKYAVRLNHPHCATCKDLVQTLVVPNQTTPYTAHFNYNQPETTYEPATLFVRCDEGGYVMDERGKRYACNVRHELPVTSSEPQLLLLQAFSASNTPIKRQQFSVRASRPIVWSL